METNIRHCELSKPIPNGSPRRLRLLAMTIILILPLAVFAADFTPARPVPERLVNNLSQQFPDLLNPDQERKLENKLVDFDNKSSNQIAIVIIDSLAGREVNEFSTALFNKWRIGQKKNNNGVLILIKPTSTEGGRKIYISTGYGLEAVLPDITCKRIIEQDIAPNFKRGDYYAGLNQATDNLMALSSKEFNQSRAPSQKDYALWLLLIFLGVIFMLFTMEFLMPRTRRSYTISKRGSNSYYPIPFFIGGGGGSSSGFGGGFGGFGGGFSGGGGAGGDW